MGQQGCGIPIVGAFLDVTEFGAVQTVAIQFMCRILW